MSSSMAMVRDRKQLTSYSSRHHRTFIKINEQYRELFKAGENVHALIVAYIGLFQKLNKQWIEFLWGPSLANVQIQDK